MSSAPRPSLKRHINNPAVVKGLQDYRTKVRVADLQSIARLGYELHHTGDPSNDVTGGVIGHIQAMIEEAHTALKQGDLPAFMKGNPAAAYELALDATDATRVLPVELRDLIVDYAT